ncbi:hypothetical protein BC941DRAFT_391525 [Chlamydoabsidia padenii]|nr:hypothetical protein BC941DRAFT_391525 [Chlamydoabsidia padenii]
MSERPVQQKPGELGSRQTQLTQLQKRYSATYKKVSEDDFGTTLRLAMKPTDPDFPFDLDTLQLQMVVPLDYPNQPATITVMNSDIPKGFAINLERGYDAYTTTTKTTLVRQLTWLDRNMEQLLQQQPSATVRFVSHPRRNKDMVAPALPDHIIKSTAAASTLTSTTVSDPTSTTSASAPTISSSSSSFSSKGLSFSEPATTDTTPVIKNTSTPAIKYSDAELAAAFGRRSKEMDQLKTRLGNSFKASKSDRTVLYISIELTDPDFTRGSLFDNGVARLRYHVPLQYPLLPCRIDIENKGVGKQSSSMIVQQFDYHVKINSDYTLFEHLNWLNRHMESILNSPAAPTSIDNVTPLLRPIRSQAPRPTPTPTEDTESSLKANLPKKSIFVDDQVKSKVVVVNDPSIVRPPGATTAQEEKRPFTTSSDEEDEDSLLEQDNHASAEPSSSSTLDVSTTQPLRRGTEIRLLQPQLDNVSLFRCVSLHVLVKCSRCKNTVDLENILPESSLETPGDPTKKDTNNKNNKRERWTSCPTCHSVIGVKFLSELIHDNASSLGLLQLAGCTAFDLLGSSFMGTCSNCMEDMTTSIRLAPNERPITHTCFHCHTKLTLALLDYRFVQIGGTERLVADQAQVMKLKTKRKSKKEAALNGGQPLPNEGTCSHYSKSKRWFRFACCGKLYPCDICHDKEEDHPYEMANRHVCGLCSKEQSAVGNKPCMACGHEFEKATGKGAFWEGGQGVRNRTLMNRNDSHKHKGASKTGSKKQERVGLAAKQKREKDQQRQQHHDD